MKYYGLVDIENLGYGFIEEDDARKNDSFIEITDEYHEQLLEEQAQGLQIVSDNKTVFTAEQGLYYVNSQGLWEKKNTEEYEAEKAKQEAERIQSLYMTRSDFFDGTIQAWGVGQDELLILIQNLLATLPIENVKKLIAVNNFKNALNFYRKHDLFTMLSNIPIPLTETMQVTITSEHWDKFFDETDKKNPEAFKELPTPEIIIIPEENTTPDEGSETNSGDSVEENQSENNLEKVESNINLDMD